MKTISLFFATFLLVACVPALAQKYRPTEQKIQFDKITANAWVVIVDDEPLDALKDSWTDYVRQELDVKSKKDSRDALIAKEVTLPRISENTGDLRAKFFTESNLSQVAVAFTTGYSTSINSEDNPKEAKNLRQLVKNFVKYYETDVLNEQIAKSEKWEKSLESAYKMNEREQKKLQRHLAKMERKMKSNRTDMNEKFDLDNQKITAQSRMVALDEIMMNQKIELMNINKSIQKLRADISHLETLFAEPLAIEEMYR